MKTHHISMTRGQTYSKTFRSLDADNRPRNLTGAKIYMAVRADLKTSPSFKLCSEDPVPDGTWRIGIVIEDQNETPGDYTVTIEPGDTSGLVALGHSDPWLYDVRILDSDDAVHQDIDMSNLDLYPQITDLPA